METSNIKTQISNNIQSLNSKYKICFKYLNFDFGAYLFFGI